MLSAETLNRVSHSYRRGYNDGYSQSEFKNDAVEKTQQGIPMKPFSDFDYLEGYRAGLNDYYWIAFRAGIVEIGRAEFMGKYIPDPPHASS